MVVVVVHICRDDSMKSWFHFVDYNIGEVFTRYGSRGILSKVMYLCTGYG